MSTYAAAITATIHSAKHNANNVAIITAFAAAIVAAFRGAVTETVNAAFFRTKRCTDL